MPSLGALACAVVLLWLLATLVYQYGPVQIAIDRRTPFKLLPSWAFFAPNPAYRDYYLVARELRRDGTLGPCTHIGPSPDCRLSHLVWNPAKRPVRILQDAMQSIKRIRKWSPSEQVVQCSLPYLLLLHYVTTQYECGPEAIATQFAVVETSGREGQRIWISFVSGFHRLSQRSTQSSSKSV
jgi:hypothetical protein